MGYLVVLVILTLCMIVHEGGHLLAMVRHGIPVQRAGIGFGPGLALSFSRFPRISNLSNNSSSPFVFTISPILFGAYVKPTEEGEAMMSRLPYASKVNIYGAGSLANIVFGLLILAIMGKVFVNGNVIAGSVLLVLCAVLLGTGLLKRAATVFGYVMPVVAALITVVAVSLATLGSPGTVMGPIGIFSEGSKAAIDFRGSIVLLIAISIGIGLSNLLPISITDGGRIAEAVLERSGVSKMWCSRYFKLSTACLIILAVFVFGNDIARLFHK